MKKILAGLILSVLLGGTPAHAQTTDPIVLISWKADSYTPAWYEGKTLAATNALIQASVIVIDRGTVKDLSGSTIYWYVNGTNTDGGVGKNTTSFRVPGIAPNQIDLQVKLPDLTSDLLVKTVKIPVVYPKVSLTKTETSTFQVNPFFFGVQKISSLIFSWALNGKPVTDTTNPYELSILPNKGEKVDVTISVSARNPLRFGESGSASTQATIGE